MKRTETRFCYKFRRPDSRRELLRAWDKAGALLRRDSSAPDIEDGVLDYETQLEEVHEKSERKDLNRAFEQAFGFDPNTVDSVVPGRRDLVH